MTFKDVKKRVGIDQKVQQQTSLFYRLDNRPFWVRNAEEHKTEDIRTNGDYWFNQIIGSSAANRMRKHVEIKCSFGMVLADHKYSRVSYSV